MVIATDSSVGTAIVGYQRLVFFGTNQKGKTPSILDQLEPGRIGRYSGKRLGALQLDLRNILPIWRIPVRFHRGDLGYTTDFEGGFGVADLRRTMNTRLNGRTGFQTN